MLQSWHTKLMHFAHDYSNCLSDFRRDIVMWSCGYLAYAT